MKCSAASVSDAMQKADPDPLASLVDERASRETPPEVTAIAEAVRTSVGEPVLAVLAYGSCLRGVSTDESLVDLYVLVDGYRRLSGGWLLRLLNRLVPPNVYYAECTFASRIVRAKYAVISLAQFESRVSPATRNPYFWARFAQPAAIVYSAGAAVRCRVLAALCQAVRTMLTEGRRLAGPSADAPAIWVAALTQTYATEFRSEAPSRASEIFDWDENFYLTATAAVPPVEATARSPSWMIRRIEGKALSSLRLIKAAFTFSGGADYLVWKIARHSGVNVRLTPWQRRHPVLAAVVLFPKLYARGAFR